MKEFDPITDFGLSWFAVGNYDPAQGIKNPAIKNVADVFKENILSVQSLVTFNLKTVGLALRLHKAWDFAAANEKGEIIHGSPIELAFQKKINETLNKWADEEKDGSKTSEFFKESISFFRSVSQFGGFEGSSEIRSIIHNMIVTGWGSFEVMAGDLWEAALNEHPKVLSLLSGKSAPNNKRSATEKKKSDEIEGMKQVKIHQLERCNFNVSKSMGTILKERCNFTVLVAIRDAYSMAFSERSHGIQKAVDSVHLDELSILRNSIVHRSARVDKDFQEKSKRAADDKQSVMMQNYIELDVGDPVNITGAQTSELMVALKENAATLIREVDDWISANP